MATKAVLSEEGSEEKTSRMCLSSGGEGGDVAYRADVVGVAHEIVHRHPEKPCKRDELFDGRLGVGVLPIVVSALAHIELVRHIPLRNAALLRLDLSIN